MLERRVKQGAERLRQLLHGGTGGNNVEIRSRILCRGVEDRFVAAYSAGSKTFVGKFYPDRQGRATREIQSVLRARIEASGHARTVAIPEALSYEDGCRCLLQSHVTGVAFESLDDDDGRAAFLRLAGRALAEVHALPVLSQPAKTLADHVTELIRPHPQRLAAEHPEHAAAIERALERLAVLQHSWRGLPTTPIHRDFHLRQLRRDGDRMWILDWDLAANGDPAFDVAYFTVYLRNHLPDPAAARGVESFLEGYLTAGSPALLSRMAGYEIFNYLRRACRRFRLRDEGWEPEMRRMLSRLSAVMARG